MSTAHFVPRPRSTSPHDFELRATLEAAHVALALIQADAALQGRPMPASLSELHPLAKRKFLDAALVALMLVNRDAELYAIDKAKNCAWENFEQFCKDHDLDWCVDHPINEADTLECFLGALTHQVITRFRHVGCGTYPGLSIYLANLQRQRITDGDPALAKEE